MARTKRKPEGERNKRINNNAPRLNDNSDRENLKKLGIKSPQFKNMPYRIKEGKTQGFLQQQKSTRNL